MVSGAIEAAEGSATTDWVTFDGTGVPAKFMFHAVFFPVIMFAFLTVPGIICWFALGFGHRGRIVQYQPPYPGRFGKSHLHSYHDIPAQGPFPYLDFVNSC